MKVRPYELLARFGSDGKIAGCHVRMITELNGKEYEGDPEPLKDATDPAFADFAEQFAAATVSENEQLKATISQLISDQDVLIEKISGLQQKITDLLAPKDPPPVEEQI